MKKCCGNCKYHTFEDIDEGFVCTNSDSDYYSDWTDYDFYCMDWEKHEKSREETKAK